MGIVLGGLLTLCKPLVSAQALPNDPDVITCRGTSAGTNVVPDAER